MLPIIDENLTPERLNFPTKWQAVIFRNYRVVPNDRIAKALGCEENVVVREAKRLGLREGDANPDWLDRGFINIIRNNWFLIPYEQLIILLDYTLERLEFILKNEDFLGVKLGRSKPHCDTVLYTPLTEKEIAETEAIASCVSALDVSERKMFDIYRDKSDTEVKYKTTVKNGRRTIHPYLTPCADPFMMDSREHLPDAILDDYAKVGVNSLIIHAVLSTLSYYPFDPSQSRDYKIRRKNLKELVERAGKRGIKISLYFNEPRAIHKDVFARYGRPELAGGSTETEVNLCLQVKENLDWFYEAIKDLFTEIPDIGAACPTTMGENRTHCWSHKSCNCHRCASLAMWEIPVLINNTVLKAVRDAGSDAVVRCSTWQWTEEMMEEGFKHLDKTIKPGVVSEWGVETNVGGVPWRVVDYSISHYGPSDYAKRVINYAHKNGLDMNVKVQLSCSWELAALPYLPLFDLELEHVQAVRREGVKDFNLTWTLGSYPSITFDMVADYLEKGDEFSLDEWYKKHFGDNAETVHEAVKLFCRGYKEYPFSCEVAYRSAKNMGVANRWSLTPNNNRSCMVGWTYDDFEYYATPYPVGVFINQFEKILVDWEKGCELLATVKGDALADEMLLFARVAGNHFKAEILHAKYVFAKKKLPDSRDEMFDIIKEERKLCLEMLELVPQSTMIGFETSNHYFYTERDIIEKLVQLDGLEKELEAI